MLTCISFSNMIKNRFLSDFLSSSFLLQPKELFVLLNQVYYSSYPSIWIEIAWRCCLVTCDRWGVGMRRGANNRWSEHHIGSHEVFCVEIPTTRPVSQIKMLLIHTPLTKRRKICQDTEPRTEVSLVFPFDGNVKRLHSISRNTNIWNRNKCLMNIDQVWWHYIYFSFWEVSVLL